MKQTKITDKDIIRLFRLLEELNDLFHQPLKYEDIEYVKNFADKFYPEIKEFYYDIVWNWLPDYEKKEIESE